jgi:hypothetical protein
MDKKQPPKVVIDEDSFRLEDYKLSILSALVSIGVGLRVPHKYRFYPLLVLGTVGALGDYFLVEKRLKEKHLAQQLEAARSSQRD